jgi:hypothetical protein
MLYECFQTFLKISQLHKAEPFLGCYEVLRQAQNSQHFKTTADRPSASRLQPYCKQKRLMHTIPSWFPTQLYKLHPVGPTHSPYAHNSIMVTNTTLQTAPGRSGTFSDEIFVFLLFSVSVSMQPNIVSVSEARSKQNVALAMVR